MRTSILTVVALAALPVHLARADRPAAGPVTTPTVATPTPGLPTLTLHAPRRVPIPELVPVTGRADNVLPGTAVKLTASPYPYTHGTVVASTTVATDGRFVFRVRAPLNVRFQAATASGARSPSVLVLVGDRVIKRVRALPLGRVRVTVLVFHPRGLRWNGARTTFWLGGHRSRPFTVRVRSRRGGPRLTLLSVVTPIAPGRFGWRVCFTAPADHALMDLQRPPACRGRGYSGMGWAPYGFPGPGGVARAAAYLRGRAGRTGFAVVDSEGRVSGLHLHWRWVTASVVKAMLLTEYLRILHARGQHYIDTTSNSFLYPMIHFSDNRAASATYARVGDGGLYALAAAAGMVDFSVNGSWGNAQLSPSDQAEFFFHIDRLLPPEFRGYAHFLLSTIAGYESWGIPAVLRPAGWFVLFKGGWRGTGLGQLVHQIGRASRLGVVFSLAVMTDGNPSMAYGIETIQGVSAALLHG